MSLSQRILHRLSRSGGGGAETNTEMAKELKAPASQISSCTNKLVKRGKLNRSLRIPRLYFVGNTIPKQGLKKMAEWSRQECP